MARAEKLRVRKLSLIPGPGTPRRDGTALRGTFASPGTRRNAGPADRPARRACRKRRGRKGVGGTPGLGQERGGPLRPASFGCQQGGSWQSQSNYWFKVTFRAVSGRSLGAFLAAFFEAARDGGVGRPDPERDSVAAFEAPFPKSLSAASISSTVFT